MKENIVYLGSEIKVNVGIEPIGGMSMEGYDFECEFYCYTSRKVYIAKDAMVMQDKDNYIATLDSRNLGSGSLKCKITAYIPDADFNDGLRTEVLIIDTGIQIMGA